MKKFEFFIKLSQVVDKAKAARRQGEPTNFWASTATMLAQDKGIIPEDKEPSNESIEIREMILRLVGMSEAHGVVDTIRVMYYCEQAWEAYQKASSVCRFTWGDGFQCGREKGHTGKHYAERQGANSVIEYAESE